MTGDESYEFATERLDEFVPRTKPAGLDQERLDQLVRLAERFRRNDIPAIALSVDDAAWLLGVVQQLREQLEQQQNRYCQEFAAHAVTMHERAAAEAERDDLHREIENLLLSLENAQLAVDAANRAGETEQERAVERAFAERRARAAEHVKVRVWPFWDSGTASYSLACSCNWVSGSHATEQAAQDEFDRHAAGPVGETPHPKRYDRELHRVAVPPPERGMGATIADIAPDEQPCLACDDDPLRCAARHELGECPRDAAGGETTEPDECSTCGQPMDSPPCSLDREAGLSGHTVRGGCAAGGETGDKQ